MTFIDNFRKGYISSEDLREVFEIMGESITEEEVNTMVKIAGVKSSDKINFKEFVDFFYKIDWREFLTAKSKISSMENKRLYFD